MRNRVINPHQGSSPNKVVLKVENISTRERDFSTFSTVEMSICIHFDVSGYFDTEKEAPRFHHTNQNVTVYKGSTALLQCVVDYLGPKTVMAHVYYINVWEIMQSCSTCKVMD